MDDFVNIFKYMTGNIWIIERISSNNACKRQLNVTNLFKKGNAFLETV